MYALMKRYLIILCLFLNVGVFAQSDSLDYFFDDGGISSSTKTINLHLLSPLNGTYTISLENSFTKQIGLDIGASYLTNYYHPELEFTSVDFEPQGGFGYSLQPKVYFDIPRTKTLERYFSLLFRQKFYQVELEKSRVYTDIGSTIGLHQDFGRRLVLDYSIGIFYRSYSYSQKVNTKNYLQGSLLALVSVRVGLKI